MNNGSATALPSGGSPGYTYLWAPGGQTTSMITNQASGTYSVTITDSKGCQKNTTAVITEPQGLTVGFSNVINVSCFNGNNGAVTANATGGTPNYTYTWSPGASHLPTINNLGIGIYTVSVKDAKACLATNTIAISQPQALDLVPTITNVNCNGASNGAVFLSPNGGTAPYTHVLMPGNISGANFSNLVPGTYSIITTDAHSCIDNATITINQPIDFSSVTNYTNSNCSMNNGSASISVTNGGTPPFTYNWLPAGGTSSVAVNLSAGNYSVTATDATGCTSTKIVLINDVEGPLVSIASTTNVSCYGGNNGAVTATHTGGTGPVYNYLWYPTGGNTLTASNLTAGTYVIKVTDAVGCVGLATGPVITEPTAINLNVVPTAVSCFGGGNGSAVVTTNGGTGAHTYNWSAGLSIGNSVNGLSSGTYSLTVSDINNCTTTSTFVITEPAPLNLSLTSTSVSCNGESNGSITSVASGGIGPYNFVTNPGNVSGQNITNLSAGNYTVNLSDNNGCSISNTIAVTEPTPIVLSTNQTNSSCSLANGQTSVTANGGTGTYFYLWQPGGNTNAVVSNLLAGSYTVTVTDANNCFATAIETVNDNSAPLISISSVTNVSCFGGTNGNAEATVVGGTAPFTFLWLPTGGNASIGTGLSVGVYTVIVTADNGCTASAVSPFISEPSDIFINVSTNDVSCNGGNNGLAIANVFGGTPNYSYSWMPGSIASSTAATLTAGNYTLQITDSNSCIESATLTINEPSQLSTILTSTSVSCFGGSNGSITVLPTGGTSPYNYNYMPGNINGQTISSLSAGNYTITTQDNNGCSFTNTVTISEPSQILLSTGSVNSNCSLANGQVSVSASGGTGSYVYLWSPSGGTNPLETNLLQGNYTVTVTDANSCSKSTTQLILDNPSPMISVSSSTNITCFGASNGKAEATVVGGTGPFTYTWSPAGGNGSTATNLGTGTFTVLVTALNGCTATAVSPLIIQPNDLIINISKTDVTCFGNSDGHVDAAVFGGTPGYSYNWVPGAIATSTIAGLPINNYTLTVTDGNNCIKTASTSIGQPNLINVSITTSSVSCQGASSGNASAVVNGGTMPYNYLWLPMGATGNSVSNLTTGTYSLIVTDANGCISTNTFAIAEPIFPLSITTNTTMPTCFGNSNATATITTTGGTSGYLYSWTQNISSSATATNLSAGNYSVTVTDMNGCFTNTVFVISQPAPIIGNLVIQDASCGLANGSIQAQISGGTGPYNYLWTSLSQTISTLNGVSPGTYTLTTTDSKGCSIVLNATVSNIVGPIVSLSSTNNVSCSGGNDGQASINIAQGTPLYNIQWLPYGGNGITAISLTHGSYTVYVTDAKGCEDSLSLVISEPAQLVATNIVIPVSCYNGQDGTASVLPTGGTTPYTYSWSTGNTSSNIINLGAGAYSVSVTDNKNCMITLPVIINEPSALTSTISNVVNATCFGGTGNAMVLVSGGSAPYSYLWNSTPAQAGNNISNVPSGNYIVNITDDKGCTTSNSVSIDQPSPIVTSVISTDTICSGQGIQLESSATGGAGNYYYSWQPVNAINSGTLTDNPLANQTYTVMAFDQNGCAGQDAITNIIVYNFSSANINVAGTTPICPGQATDLYVQTNGNTGQLTYSWSNNLGNTTGLYIVTPTQPTTYYVTVTSACGVSITDSLAITFNPPPAVALVTNTTSICAPGIINFIDQSVTGNPSDPISSWQWDFGDGTFTSLPHPSHQYLTPGTYTVKLTVTTDAGCVNSSVTTPVIINAYATPVASFFTNGTLFNLPYDELHCTNTSQNADAYNWDFGDGVTSSAISPNHEYDNIGFQTIQLIASSQNGCSDTSAIIIETRADVVFPNAFTPGDQGGSDGYYNINNLSNDIFFPVASGVVEYNLQIFNRWGELIFETEDIKQGWDGTYRGKPCEMGVYVWKAKVKLNNGYLFKKAGDVTLLR